MIAILSSAKTMDFSSPWQAPAPSLPECLGRAQQLAPYLRKLSAGAVSELMEVSPKIANLNAERFKRLSFPHTAANAKPALLAYQGDVFRAMKSASFGPKDLLFAQKTVRILSGLYGVVRPLDLIQPYRLEMAIPISGPNWSDLYDFWSVDATRLIDRDAQKQGGVIVNLASQEYSRVLKQERLKSRVLNISFKQNRKGKVMLVPILAKHARGLMANHIIVNRFNEPEGMKQFQTDGYRFSAGDSGPSEWVFIRSA